MIKKFLLFIFMILILTITLYSADDKNWSKEKEKAEELYKYGKFDESIILFREIILTSNNKNLIGESYFWLAMAYMNTEKYKQAEVNLEYYLANYKTSGLNYNEAVYQKGRLLFLQEEYQSSIEQFNFFLKNYPFNSLVSNAYYWIGECLYALGQFDDSGYYFNIVISKFPNSIKNEASRYKLRLIEHKKSELALQNLLKWSQEQYLSALNQFRIKEKTLREALDKYEHEGTSSSSNIDTEKYKKLQKENENLKKEIERLENQLSEFKSSITNRDILDKLRQLELKEQLLRNKEETLNLFEGELRKREKVLE